MSDETVTVKWVYGGVRMNVKGQRTHAFIPDMDAWEKSGGSVEHENWYKFTGLNAVVGGVYEIQQLAGDDRSVVRGKPVYAGLLDSDRRRPLWARDTAEKAKLSNLADERGRLKDNPIDELLDPVIEVLKTLRTGADRDLVIAHINRRLISESWNPPKRRDG